MTETIAFIILGAISLLGALVSLVGTLSSLKTEHRLTELETQMKLLPCRKEDCPFQQE
jgi:hypothetical protein